MFLVACQHTMLELEISSNETLEAKLVHELVLFLTAQNDEKKTFCATINYPIGLPESQILHWYNLKYLYCWDKSRKKNIKNICNQTWEHQNTIIDSDWLDLFESDNGQCYLDICEKYNLDTTNLYL